MTGVLVAPALTDEVIASALALAQLRNAADDRESQGLEQHYQLAPERYIRERLGWEPWRGTPTQPGQADVIDAYTLAIRQQLERAAWERGERGTSALTCWQPGQTIQNRLRLEAGHTVGKTKLGSGLVNHFFDCFTPSIVYTFAPTWPQIHDLLWKEIKIDRRGAGLPGRILEVRLERAANHFATGRATNNNAGTGAERVQGQHGEHLMFVLDEAEGIADWVWDAVDSMASGGTVVIVLEFANPRTRSSRFHREAARPDTRSFRISCIDHPNVTQNLAIVPGAVRRDYVDAMIRDHATVVETPDVDLHTFTVPWRPGLILQPDAELCFQVLGIAPSQLADNTFVPVGRFENACRRAPDSELPTHARMGVDVARFGRDMGTLYLRHNGRVWRAAQFAQLDTFAYAQTIRSWATRLREAGVRQLQIRIDGGGGFGGGVIDQLSHDADFTGQWPAQERPLLVEAHFGGSTYSAEAYADLVTEMYAAAGEQLKVLGIVDAPHELEDDLCARQYGWVTVGGRAVKRLEPKDHLKARLGRSPDDGDGFVLAVAPDYVFVTRQPGGMWAAPDEARVAISSY